MNNKKIIDIDAVDREMKKYEKRIMRFKRDDENLDFVPASKNPDKPGMYVTLKCGRLGITQKLSQWNGTSWVARKTDEGMTTIAFLRKPVVLKTLVNSQDNKKSSDKRAEGRGYGC